MRLPLIAQADLTSTHSAAARRSSLWSDSTAWFRSP